ncbi:MAG: 50S ribosomal protein L31e [Halobacteriota archaeon]
MEERVITVPLRDARSAPKQERADKAMKLVREDLARQFDADADEVNLDTTINHAVWSRGRTKVPSKLRIRAAKFEDGVVEAEMAE